jgi:hypothetical protein
MKTTLNKIKEHKPCKEGWEKLLKSLNKTKADDEELSLLTILDSNGIKDTLWCFRAVEGIEPLARKFSKWCALQNITLIKSYCSEEQYNTIITYLNSNTTELRSAAWSAAESAAWSAAESDSAWSAAWSAAESAESDSAWSAAWSAAESAAWSAAESDSAWSAAWSAAESAAWLAQASKLRELLEVYNEI